MCGPGPAAASGARWQRGAPLGPLYGVPVSIKHLILPRGGPTRRGSRAVDGAGSIRIPAASCGVFGFKPSFGRVPAWTVWNTLTPAQQALCDPVFAAQAAPGARLSVLAVPACACRAPGSVPMDPASMLGWTPFSYRFNLTQQPACSLPCGLTADGLPAGLQRVGPMFADALVLRAARAVEATCPPARAPRP